MVGGCPVSGRSIKLANDLNGGQNIWANVRRKRLMKSFFM
jgi:hypothetical protein